MYTWLCSRGMVQWLLTHPNGPLGTPAHDHAAFLKPAVIAALADSTADSAALTTDVPVLVSTSAPLMSESPCRGGR